MIEKLKILDADFVLFVNGKHTPFLDSFFYFMSEVFVWIPLYIFLIIILIKKYKSQTWLVLVCLALLITATDQFASGLIKNSVMRYRPTHNLFIGPKIHLVNDYTGGMYGFISSHAANVFALTTFIALLFKESKKKYIWLLWLWAATVSFSRIYLGVHYLSDVVGGIVSGMFFGWVFYKLFIVLNKRNQIHSLK